MSIDDVTPSKLAALIQKSLRSQGQGLKLARVQEAVAYALGNGADMNEFTARVSFRGMKHPRDESSHQKCRHCGSKLNGYYCSQSSCYYSDWPQYVPLFEKQYEQYGLSVESLNLITYGARKRDPLLKEVYSINNYPTLLGYRRRWDDILLLRGRADELRDQLFNSFADEVEASQVLNSYQRYDYNSSGSLPAHYFQNVGGEWSLVFMRELRVGCHTCVSMGFSMGEWTFVFEARKPPPPLPMRTKRRNKFQIPDLRFGWEEIQRSKLYWSDKTLRCLLEEFVTAGERKAEEWMTATAKSTIDESRLGTSAESVHT